MFTGIVEGLGTIAAVARRAGAARLTIALPRSITGLRRGGSLAVDGVCLTVTRAAGRTVEADAIPETLARTTLGTLRRGDRVNLETPLSVGSPLSGHFVSGHIDADVRVVRVVRDGNDRRLRLQLPHELARFVAQKGSVALHGVSLTVSGVTTDEFEVALIPETLRSTTLGAARVGSRLNVEVDLLARYLDRWRTGGLPQRSPRRRPQPGRGRR